MVVAQFLLQVVGSDPYLCCCTMGGWGGCPEEKNKIDHELQLLAASGELFQLPKVV